MADGWLYGEVGGGLGLHCEQVDSGGEFTGSDITFLYPGLRRGLRGEWREGKLIKAKGVEVSGTRCRDGLLELQFEEVSE